MRAQDCNCGFSDVITANHAAACSIWKTGHMIGIPDPKILAAALFCNGHHSIAEAEAAGWIVTNHFDTRRVVDEILFGL